MRRWTLDDLVRFHTAEKLLLMAHDLPRYRELGRLVASARSVERATLAGRYLATYLLGQRYLEPHPRELMLRNHA